MQRKRDTKTKMKSQTLSSDESGSSAVAFQRLKKMGLAENFAPVEKQPTSFKSLEAGAFLAN